LNQSSVWQPLRLQLTRPRPVSWTARTYMIRFAIARIESESSQTAVDPLMRNKVAATLDWSTDKMQIDHTVSIQGVLHCDTYIRLLRAFSGVRGSRHNRVSAFAALLWRQRERQDG
jgi:hypothetical protein